MNQTPPEPGRLELCFDHYVLDGHRLEENEWIAVELPGGLGTKVGRYLGLEEEDHNKPVLQVFMNGEPSGSLTFPPQVANVRRSTQAEVEELSRERREPERDRVQGALEMIERAQGLLRDASSELSPVLGYADEWSELGRVHGVVRELWDTVDHRRTEIAAQTLRLKDDGGGDRYFLSGRPVHAGDVIEFQDERDEWVTARFEWTGLIDDPPALHPEDDRTIPLPESSEHHVQLFRWPQS